MLARRAFVPVRFIIRKKEEFTPFLPGDSKLLIAFRAKQFFFVEIVHDKLRHAELTSKLLKTVIAETCPLEFKL
jgi:hypothetical protein